MSRHLTIADALATIPNVDSPIDQTGSHDDPYYIVKHARPATKEAVDQAVNRLIYTTGESWLYHSKHIPRQQGNDCRHNTEYAIYTDILLYKLAGPDVSWYYRWHRSGTKQVRKDTTVGGKSGVARSGHKTKKCRCTARLVVHYYPLRDIKFDVELKQPHINHQPNTIEDDGHLPLPQDIRDQVEETLKSGITSDVRTIREYLQDQNANAPVTSRQYHIHTRDVYNKVYKWRKEKTTNDANDFKSVELWLTELEQEKQFAVWRYATISVDTFCFGFSSPWQLSMFENAKYLSIDATHHVCGYAKGLLYTIIIRHPEADRGVPISYLFTVDHSAAPLAKWFTDLKLLDISPIRVTIDCSNVELNAIRLAWGDTTSIQFCTWHVFRAWIDQYKKKARGSALKKKMELVVLRDDLKKLMWERNERKFKALWRAFSKKWSKRQFSYFAYFSAQWMTSNKSRLWAACYQLDTYTNMETNNYVESWHNQLKSVYLKRYRVHRLDYIVFVLVTKVEFDLLHDVQRRAAKVGPQTKRDLELAKTKLKADQLSHEMMLQKVSVARGGGYYVQSFTTNPNPPRYKLHVEGEKIMSCTCKEAQYHRQRACKHMYLLKRWHGNLTLRYERQPTAIQFSAPSNPPTQQPQSSTPPSNPPTQIPSSPTPAPIDDDHPTHDDDKEMVDADDLNKV
ncbi:hypothetical protein RO3G_15174 [Lichtheimia corymbifera JMRC:FSU:9682]|uniref:SWIM-type domain-containing protein n=1 Tax=Lichtheimia corymbifera JMRC:FSU:9682 TaxID=1263082 RepID=A0A068SH91_9FUNG|nr:hypothetical protein RO3G_15174 [Lichtheimia corymbifera JMRC:FSU:9682]